MWINRTTHPHPTFRVIIKTDSNETLERFVKCIDNTTPVKICIKRIILSINPMFHRNEMVAGVGKSTKELFNIFIRASFFRVGAFI